MLLYPFVLLLMMTLMSLAAPNPILLLPTISSPTISNYFDDLKKRRPYSGTTNRRLWSPSNYLEGTKLDDELLTGEGKRADADSDFGESSSDEESNSEDESYSEDEGQSNRWQDRRYRSRSVEWGRRENFSNSLYRLHIIPIIITKSVYNYPAQPWIKT